MSFAKDSCGLSPGRAVESPGSSVFDLPTQLSNTAQLERRSAHLQEVSGQLTVDDLSPRFLVISGGTGGNSICSAFGDACYVLPVSDDGGSSSEIIRVLGGPSVGAHSYSFSVHPLTDLFPQATYGLDW